MIYPSSDIISQIKRANDDTDIQVILEEAFHKLFKRRGKDTRAKRMFMINLIMALKYESATNGLAEEVKSKVMSAISQLDNMRKEEPHNLF